MLSEDFHKLSINEQNRIYEDIHAVGKVVEETPEIVQRGITQMQQELDAWPYHQSPPLNRSSYDEARRRDLRYVDS